LSFQSIEKNEFDEEKRDFRGLLRDREISARYNSGMTLTLKQNILDAAVHEVGFTLAGVAGPEAFDPGRYHDWLDRGYAGSMAYLHRNLEKRFNPSLLIPGVRSILCVGLNYYQETSESQPAGVGRVSLYARGADYHRVVRQMLHRLAEKIRIIRGGDFHYRAFVDSAPVMEKLLAVRAGLGWIGKNGCLVNRHWGSFLFLGELFVDFEIEPDTPTKNYCGRCRRCIDACPTGAIVAPQTVDARRCVSYLTIEHRGEIDEDLKSKMGHRLFGCDQCQNVCPFNRKCRETLSEEFRRPILGESLDPNEILNWDETICKNRTTRSAGERADLQQWRRNARIVLKNLNPAVPH
jgi:epoxyqueuosine reductase